LSSTADPAAPERRLLLLTPTGRDAELSRRVLAEAGIVCATCEDWSGLCHELQTGAGAVLIAEEALLADGEGAAFAKYLEAQPPWSDLPVLILTGLGADSPAVQAASQTLGNVTLLERPIRVGALVSSVRTALRARDRQYQIRNALEELEQTAQALRESESQLREADMRKDEFLATLAHELRNPLAPIRNSLQILRLTGESDPTLQRVREMMERQLNLMVRLVDDLLEVSRITRGKIDLHMEELSVAAIMRAAIETSRPVIDAGHHAITIDVPTGLPPLRGDAMRLAQVFANLLNNAAKYTDDGGSIHIGSWREEDEVVVSIRDSGIGIAPDLLPRVFEMFMQVRRTARRAQGGLGVGLTLVKSLVELHGGSVQARSDGPGKGSEFIVRLPVASGSERAGGSSPSLPSGGVLRDRKVLVVDDNRDAADSLAMLLRLMGADVRVAYGGEDAYQSYLAFRPSVSFLDIGMPEVDGYEVARRIRRDPASESAILVALTGWGQEDDRRRSSEAGFNHHLVKPVHLELLESVLHAALAPQTKGESVTHLAQ
jgi:signal transduction histidine kinase/ActR/RegA family two-component response regulator